MFSARSLCIGLLAASLSSTAISAAPLNVMGLTVGESWAAAQPKLRAACASLEGCDAATPSRRLSTGDWYTIQLSGKVGDKECTRLDVDFVRKGRTLLVNEIAVTYLCLTEASSSVTEQKLKARFGPHTDKQVQALRDDSDKAVTNLLWGPKPLALSDVLSNERMQDTVPGVYLRTPKQGVIYVFASIESSKASGASAAVLSVVLTHGSLTALRHELMVQAHATAAVAVPVGSPGS